ncbi:CheR family methyltransferase [Methylobacillus sp. Pita2]|uniref:CheR family methyltransferase n=1 Tax=Methylobacillus sp. Pita2 TaxID=3383245 RepID=UPI0038B5F24A
MNSSTVSKSSAGKEFDFTEADFARVRKLIYQAAGISLSDSKHEMVYSRLARRLRATGISSFQHYLDVLESGSGSDEWEAFTNALTTNLTSFFREHHHFPILAEHIRKAAQPISIWCCASSTGEEPYSLAITACEAFGTLRPPVEIIATDIDTNVLATAAAGIYTYDRIEKLPMEQKKKFFLRGTGKQQGMVRVRDDLRKLISFRPLNLLDGNWPVRGPFDAIFCRNVMIYFDKPTQAAILKRFAPLMKPDGLLFAGHSENFLYATDAFKLLGKTVYTLERRGG